MSGETGLMSLTPHPSSKWRNVDLANVVDLRLSSVDKKTKDNEHAVLLCNYTDVYKNDFIHTDMHFMAATATNREIVKCSLQAGDVIITKDSEKYDDIGVPALMREDVPSLVCGYHLAILRPSPSELDGTYLFYVLRTRKVQHQFHSYANGITRFGLRKADIGLVQIPLPPLPEQRAIAQALRTLDDKIEMNRRMCETLDEMARALFRSWFVDFDPVRAKMEDRWSPGESLPGLPAHWYDLFPDRLVDSELGEIPEGWHVGTLGRVMEVNPRRSIRRGEMATHVGMAALPTSGPHVASWTRRPFTSGSRFTLGDTLLARITPSLENGKTALVDFLDEGEMGWGSTEFIVLRPKHPWLSTLAYLLARHPSFRRYAISNMTGTSGRQRVPAEAVANYAFIAPPEDIAVAFGNIVQSWFEFASSVNWQSKTLATLRDALSPVLVSREVRVEGLPDAG